MPANPDHSMGKLTDEEKDKKVPSVEPDKKDEPSKEGENA